MQGVVKDPLHICRWGKEGEPLSEKEAEVSPRGGEIGLQCCVKWKEKTPWDEIVAGIEAKFWDAVGGNE